MQSITIYDQYQVYLKSGLLKDIGALLHKQVGAKKLAVIADATVWRHYGHQLCTVLSQAGFSVIHYILKGGEQEKNLHTLEDISMFLSEQAFTHSDMLLSFGGGVVGDIAGFVAAVYLRGIPYCHIPTTLLAMIDSSIGGKTAVNLPVGKNLIGAFWQPHAVFCDPELLQTLPQQVYNDGIAEVIKYAVLADAELLNALSSENIPLMNIITRCIEIKNKFIVQDERDEGVRRFLNLGHTLAHAIEARSAYTLSHGSAVSIGLVTSARLSFVLGISEADLSQPIAEILARYALPIHSPYPADELFPYIRKDKKRTGEQLSLILPKAIGVCCIETFKIHELEKALETALTKER